MESVELSAKQKEDIVDHIVEGARQALEIGATLNPDEIKKVADLARLSYNHVAVQGVLQSKEICEEIIRGIE